MLQWLEQPGVRYQWTSSARARSTSTLFMLVSQPTTGNWAHRWPMNEWMKMYKWSHMQNCEFGVAVYLCGEGEGVSLDCLWTVYEAKLVSCVCVCVGWLSMGISVIWLFQYEQGWLLTSMFFHKWAGSSLTLATTQWGGVVEGEGPQRSQWPG